LSRSPPYADSGAYFCEFGCSLVDIDTNIRRFGQGISKGQPADTPTAKELINKYPKGKNLKKREIKKKFQPDSDAKLVGLFRHGMQWEHRKAGE
jgi:hypothetical protein